MGGRKASRLGRRGEKKGRGPCQSLTPVPPWWLKAAVLAESLRRAGREMKGQGEGMFVPGAGQFYLRQRSK